MAIHFFLVIMWCTIAPDLWDLCCLVRELHSKCSRGSGENAPFWLSARIRNRFDERRFIGWVIVRDWLIDWLLVEIDWLVGLLDWLFLLISIVCLWSLLEHHLIMWSSTWFTALTKALEGTGKVEKMFNIWHAAQTFYVLSTWGLALVGWVLIYYFLLPCVSNLTYYNKKP